MKYERFYDVREELEEKGEAFTPEQLKRLSFKDLMLAFVGNAGEAVNRNWDQYKEEEKRRIDAVSQHSLIELCNDKGKWNILDDMSMLYAVIRSRVEKTFTEETAPKWRLLVHYMQQLRGDWSYGRNSPDLEMIYKLIPDVLKESIVPEGWLHAVRNNADEFDGHFCDGRVMRDGQLFGGFSGNLARSVGFHPVKQESGYYGGYEELFEKILTPEQQLQYLTPIEDLEDSY